MLSGIGSRPDRLDLTLDDDPFQTATTGVTPDGAFEPVGYWHETVDVTPTEPLAGSHEADVVVVGGGYTGLSTAHEIAIRAPELEVVLLERAAVGFGASGRNGGFVMPLLGWDMVHLASEVGSDRIEATAGFMYEAVEWLRRLIDEEELECDKEDVGYLLLNTSPEREAHTRDDHEIATETGFEREWLEGAALREHIDSPAFYSGTYDPVPFVVNPAKLARERKRLAEAAGVRVVERSPVVALREHDAGVTVETQGGSVTAETAVLAVNGYGEALGFRTDRFLPVHTFITMTEPLTEAQLASIGWAQRRTSLETARNFIHYFRLTADNRILFGGEDVQLYYGGRFHDRDGDICLALRERFREFFPPLSDVAFTHEWGGVLSVTMDMFPSMGAASEEGRVLFASGYSGHGVALGNYAGQILAPQVIERLGLETESGPEPFFVNRDPPWVAPDPLRYTGLQLYRRALKAQDRWQGA